MGDIGEDGIVVDAGRLRWRVGIAGDDEPKARTDALDGSVVAPVVAAAAERAALAPELAALAAACATPPGERERGAFAAELVEHAMAGVPGAVELLWDVNVAMFEDFLQQQRLLVAADDPVLPGAPVSAGPLELLSAEQQLDEEEEAEPLPLAAVVAVPCLEDPMSSAILTRLRRLFFEPGGAVARAGWRCISLAPVPQELLPVYSNGRTTALSAMLGTELSVVAVYEGYALHECARKRRWPAQSSPELVAELFAELLADAIFSAPIDCRADLMRNIVVSGQDKGLADSDWRAVLEAALHQALDDEACRKLARSLGAPVPGWRERKWAQYVKDEGGHRRSPERSSFFLDHDSRMVDAPRRQSAYHARDTVRNGVRCASPNGNHFNVYNYTLLYITLLGMRAVKGH